MLDRLQSGRGACHRTCIGTYVILAAMILVSVAGDLAAGDTITITPTYRVGEQLEYSWHLENELSWSPAVKGSDWVKMSTDFDFVLDATRLTHDGGCLFDLDGTSLESIGESSKGKLGIRATETEVSYLLGKHWTKPGPNTPFAKPMTVTLGPQFQPTASTGVEAIALFLLPGVDPRVWFVVTTAPAVPMTIGSNWTQDFDIEIPGATGDPLHVVIGINVVGTEKIDGADVLVIEAKGELNLVDSDIRMQDGRLLHIVHGRYEVTGTAKWDIDRGFLRFATAEQTLKATADRPETHRLASRAVSRLSLLKTDSNPGLSNSD